MRKLFLCIICLFCLRGYAFDKLSDAYLVNYGDPEATVHIIQYFSFTCPHCVALFRKEFQQIKEEYIETKKIFWTFHPVPMDLLTVQAMDCLSHLTESEKKIFQEAILEELFIDNPKLSACLMQKGMEVLEKPLAELHDKSYLTKTDAFQDSFEFLKQDKMLQMIPAVEINGALLPGQIPDRGFIETALQKIGETS